MVAPLDGITHRRHDAMLLEYFSSSLYDGSRDYCRWMRIAAVVRKSVEYLEEIQKSSSKLSQPHSAETATLAEFQYYRYCISTWNTRSAVA